MLLLPTSDRPVVSLIIRKSPVQSPSSSKSSQSVPGIKPSNKSDWHSLGSLLPNLSFWKVAMLASSCSQSRKDGYLDAHSSGERNGILALIGSTRCNGSASLCSRGWSLQGHVPGTDVRSSTFKRTQVSAAASVGNTRCNQSLRHTD